MRNSSSNATVVVLAGKVSPRVVIHCQLALSAYFTGILPSNHHALVILGNHAIPEHANKHTVAPGCRLVVGAGGIELATTLAVDNGRSSDEISLILAGTNRQRLDKSYTTFR